MNINNINNHSLVLNSSDYIYYSDIHEEEGGIYRKSLVIDKNEKIVSGINTSDIQKNKESLYYASDRQVHKLDLDINKPEIIFTSEYFISFISVVDENIYINLSDENSSLIMKNLSTGKETKILEDVYGFNIYKENIYYAGNEKFGIYKLNMESEEKEKVIDDNVMFPIIANDMLYYFEENNKEFWEFNLKTNEIVKLGIDLEKIGLRDVNFYNIIDDKLIFSSSCGIFKFNLNTKELIKLKDYYSNEINIIEDVIFCSVYIDGSDYIYGLKEDGTELYKL